MDRGHSHRPRVISSVLVAGVFGAVLASCFTGSDGLLPPTDQLYFPTGVLVSPGRTTLYVVNSDFDLQYNGGTVMALNLASTGDQEGLREVALRVAAAIDEGAEEADVCAAIGSTPNQNLTLFPGPCEPIAIAPFIRAFATVGAFAAGMTFMPKDDGEPGARLFVSVRGDPSVTYFDVTDDRTPDATSPCESDFCLECIAVGDERRCDRRHRVGENIFTSQRGLLLPTEPANLAGTPGTGSDPLVVVHQTKATASLVVNNWPTAGNTTPFESTPSLEFLLEGVPEGPTYVVPIPAPALVAAGDFEYRPGFVLSHRAANALTVVRFFDDAGAAPPRPFLVRADDVPLTISNDGTDSRGMAFDTTERSACEELCVAGEDTYQSCLIDCLAVPVPFYVASRSPSSLLVGTLTVEPNVGQDDDGNAVVTSLTETITIDESVPLPLGPAIVSMGKIIDESGELETRVFVVSFDSRFITIYDPRTREIDDSVRTGRGPFGIAFDTGPDASGELRSLMYLTHFTDSYLSVVNLDKRQCELDRCSYAAPLINVGPPITPREEQ